MISREKLRTLTFYLRETLQTSLVVAKREIFYLTAIEFVQIPLPLIQAYLAKLIMDQISLRLQGTGGSVEQVLFYLLLECLTVLMPAAVGLLQGRQAESLRFKTKLFFKERFLQKLSEIELVQLESSKIQNEIQEIRYNQVDPQSILNSIFQIIRGFFIVLSFFGLLFSHNVFIALALVVVSLGTWYVQHESSKSLINQHKNSLFDDRLQWYLEQLLVQVETAKEIKSLNVGTYFQRKHQELQQRLLSERMRVMQKNDFKGFFSTMVSKVLYYGSYGWVVLETLAGRLSLGDMTMVLMLFSQSQGGLANIFSAMVRLYENYGKLQITYNFWNLPNARSQSASSEEMNQVLRDFTIEFKEVSFAYPGTEKPILAGFNLVIPAGEKVALVGENGAGKSTLIKLLLGLYEPTTGQILVGGVPLTNFSRQQLKEIMGVVFQDYMKLLGVSIQGNLMIGNLSADSSEYSLAKEHAGVNEVLASTGKTDEDILGKNYATQGVELSGGQWQKLALGRAFIQSAKIIILDEPTSSIDARTEHEIFERFQSLTKGKTSVLVSHRFSTVRMADRIVVLDQGRIVEQGTHEELLGNGQGYARMFHLQARGYK